jgi:monoamine oxidase
VRGRTPLFRRLTQAVQQAHWLNQNPDKRSLFFEAREAARISRRDFVRMLGAAGLLTSFGTFAPAPMLGKESGRRRGHETAPVAIVGGGIAGLTAAYRLNQAGVSCEIFEGSERIGGRVLTKYGFNQDAMFCELGGELVDTNHRDLITLAEELGVGIEEMKGVDKGVDLYFFGGRYLTDAELIPVFQPFARRLAADLKGLYDSSNNFTAKGRAFDRTSLAAYLASAGGEVEKWLIELLRVAYVIEYGRDAEEQSSLNLIVYLSPDTTNGFKIFGESDESKRIKGGSSTLPSALVAALEGKVRINRGHRLTRIAESNGNLSLDFAAGTQTRRVRFSRMVCTIPFTMLRMVEGVKALPLSPAKTESIAHLGYGNNIKSVYGFVERWWRNPAVALPAASNGSVYTDLPLQCTWETSRAQPGARGILTNYLGGAAATQFSGEHDETFREGLNRIFPGIIEKFDGTHAVMNWPRYKFVRGSYACPLVGQYTTLLQAAGESELDGRLIFAGEHTSADFSGFMNGAIQSGNRAAREIIGARQQGRLKPVC